MEHMFKRFLALTTVMSCFGISAMVTDNNRGTVSPTFVIRSQGTNALRRYVGTADMMNLYDTDRMNGFFSIMPEYTRSFNGNRITECLFGMGDECNNDCSQILIQGLNAENRVSTAWFANYFALPNDYSSVVTFKPVIQNFLVDFFGYVGLDSCYEGLYAWIQFPVTWTKWDLGFCERVINAGEQAVPAGVLAPGEVSRDQLQPDFKTYIRGAQLDPFVNGDTSVTFEALKCGKICGSNTETAVSEVRFALGYNFLLCEDYHFGLNLQASAPSGNNPCTDFLFAPQNGNGKHWELGVGIDAHAILWRCEEEDSHLGFYLSANITHMFNSNQRRCFDLCGKPLSRYMTAAKINTPNTDTELHNADAAVVPTTFPANVFSNVFAPIANITSFNVDVSVAVNADVVAMFNYTCGNWSWDLGYNFWGRSCEKLKLDCKCPQTTFAENTWVINGDSSQFGCESETGTSRALSASDSDATIFGGSNFPTLPPYSNAQLVAGLGNAGVNNAAEAAFGANDLFICSIQQGNEISTSIQPVYIKATDINFAKTQGISNKIFSHIGYNWECECWNPFFGIGFEAEFAQHNNNDCKESCATSCKNECDNDLPGDCVRCGLSQWGIWVKGGVAFN